ncbi:MAG: hypothetical protein ABH879_08525 [archaeon]
MTRLLRRFTMAAVKSGRKLHEQERAEVRGLHQIEKVRAATAKTRPGRELQREMGGLESAFSGLLEKEKSLNHPIVDVMNTEIQRQIRILEEKIEAAARSLEKMPGEDKALPKESNTDMLKRISDIEGRFAGIDADESDKSRVRARIERIRRAVS